VEPQRQRTSIDVIASALEPLMPDLGRVSSPDGAVTLMLSDIADASILAERLGPEPWEQLLRDHSALVEQVVSRHDGELFTRRSSCNGPSPAQPPAPRIRPGPCVSACTRDS